MNLNISKNFLKINYNQFNPEDHPSFHKNEQKLQSYIHLYTDSEDFKNKRDVNYHEPFVGAFVNDTDDVGTQYNKINMIISQDAYALLRDGAIEIDPGTVGNVDDGNTAKYYDIKRLKVVMRKPFA